MSLRSVVNAVTGRSHMPRDVWILTLNAFFVAVGFGVMMPVLPVFAREFGVSAFEVSWVISSFALMRLVISPFSGRITERFGERFVLAFGVFLVAITSAIAGLATEFWQLLVFRALGGLGSALFTVAAMGLLLRSVLPSMRGRASGFYQGGFLLGGMAGPALGGIVASISIRAPFFFYAITLAIGGLLCLIFIRPREDSPLESASATPGTTLAQAWSDVRYRAACVMGFSQGWGALGVRVTLIPMFVTEVLLLAPEWTGYAFAIGSIAQTLMLAPAGRWTDTIGRRPVVVAAGIITGLATIAQAFAPNIWVLIGILVIFGIGAALQGTGPTAAVGDAIGGRGGTPIAVFSMIVDLGVIIGPPVSGLLADYFGLQVAIASGGVLLLLASAYALRMPPGGAPDEPSDEQLAAAH